MLVELPRDDLVGSLTDEVGLLLIQQLQLYVGLSCCFLQNAKCLDELSWHGVPPGTGLKILERTLGLGPPVTIRGDRDVAHGVLFNTRLRRCRDVLHDVPHVVGSAPPQRRAEKSYRGP